MGRARRLTAAAVLVSLLVAACDVTAQPTASPGILPFPTIDVLRPDPNAPSTVERDPRAPGRLAGTMHDLRFIIDERHITIAEGLVREVWTVGDTAPGTVPGPVIRVQIGDSIRVHLDNNPPELPGRAAWMHPATDDHHHSVVLDASTVDPGEVASVRPGAELIYDLTAERVGVWRYHCATEPTLEHLANGEYGMLIVEPEGGLDPVDEELFLVQGEWYVGPPHQSMSLAKAAAAAPTPDFVVFNGIAGQYLEHPIAIETGARVRVFILNAGPNLVTSFRVEGAIFDRVIRDGLVPRAGTEAGWGDRAVDLLPGQGAVVEFTLLKDGAYRFIGNPAGLAGDGAMGLFQARDHDPPS